MKLFKTQTFGLPGAGRRMANGTRFFGCPVIPVTVDRETTRLVLYDTADRWRGDWIVDHSNGRSWVDPNANVPPRGTIGRVMLEDEWIDEDEYA